MALPKIGLQAILEDANFKKGLKSYLDGLDKMEDSTEDMAEAAKAGGKKIDALGDDMKKGGRSALDLAAQMIIVSQAMNVVKELAGKGLELAKLGATAERVEERFEAFAEEAGGATAMLEAFQKGAGGAASEMDAMLASSKLLQMGLVTNAEEMEATVELATRLGDQTASVTARVEDFALMLANQSIPRLDNFGISSGQVRARITELMGSVEGMTRETAFMQATMEAGGESLAILGERTKDTAMTFEIMEARMADAKVELGKGLAPIFGAAMDVLGGLGDEVLMVAAAFGEFGGALVQAGPLLNAMLPALGKLPGALKAMNLGLNASTLAVGGLLVAIPILIKVTSDLIKTNKEVDTVSKEAVKVAKDWDNAIAAQISSGKEAADVFAEYGQKAQTASDAWNANIVTSTILGQAFGAHSKILKVIDATQKDVIASAVTWSGTYDEAVKKIDIYNSQLTDSSFLISGFTEEVYNNILAFRETVLPIEAVNTAVWDMTEAMLAGDLAALGYGNELFFLNKDIQNAGEGAEDSESRFRHLTQALQDGTIITDENATAQANLVYELGLQEQALEDSKAAAEEAARVQEELALAQERAIDATIRQQQEYLTLAERMMGLDDKGFARQVLGLINELQDDHVPIGEQYDAAFRSTQDEFGLTDKKGRFLAEGFDIIEKAARRGGLGELTLIEATDLLRDAWKRGETDSLKWAENLGLAPPLTDKAATSAELFGTKLDGMKLPLGAVTTGVGYLGDAADKLKKPTDDAKDAVFDFTRKNIEAEEPIQRTEKATRMLERELRGTLDPTNAMTGAVELYGEAGDASAGPVEALTGKTNALTTAAGESVGPFGDAETAVDDFAESTLEAQDPVDELLARFELLPDQILTLAPQMRQAGESLVGAFRVGFEGAFDALEEEKVKRLKIFREEFHASREPKDPTSPLRGFFEAGAALVQTYIDGLESEWPNLGKTLDDMFTFGRAFGGLGGIAGGILGKDIRGMKAATKGIDAELLEIYKRVGGEGRPRTPADLYRGIAEALGGGLGGGTGEENLRFLAVRQQMGKELTEEQERALRIWRNVMPLMHERHELTQEQVRLQEKLTRMEEQQTRLRFLEQQVALLKLIEKHGLDASDILDGLQLGADASAEEVLDAMTRAMEEVIRQAEERLGIQSPSAAFRKIGQQTMQGMAMGIQDLASLPVRQSMLAASATASAPARYAGRDYNVTNSRRVTVNSGGNVFNTGMDETGFSARTTRDVSRAMRGI